MKEFGYVMCAKRIVNKKLPVQYMYREEASDGDSGWRFFTGAEDQRYVNNPRNIGVYDIKTILDIDKSIARFLDAPAGTAFERASADGVFIRSELRFENSLSRNTTKKIA